MNGVLGITVRP